jgi:2-hydroxycyclohexanecarboxyl-CoA dehydrogenase
VNVADAVILITGAASGIGRALALGFAADGARVVAVDRDEDGLRSLSAETGGAIATAMGDVRHDSAVARVVQEAHERFGSIDVLINNAGIGIRGGFLERPFADWQAVIDVNLTGLARCAYYVLPGMLERGHGRLINVASRAAERGGGGLAAYGASKAGVVALTRALSLEVSRERYPDVLVNALIPGPTRSGMMPEGQDPALVYPHARFLVGLPPGGPHGRVFWNSEEYAIWSRFND